MEEEGEGSFKSFLNWAVAELGITDSPSNCPRVHSSSCLGHSLCVSHFPDAGGRGLAAARELKRGELVLRVPKTALLMRESVMMSDQRLSLALNSYTSLSSTQVLTVCLLYEVGKGKNSRWCPYLMQLPRIYNILAGFGPFEIHSLQVNDAIWTAENAKERAEFDWNQATPLMEELHLKRGLRTFRAWLWAFATISSRTLHIPWDAAGCLCPVGDLLNYAPPGEEADSEISSETSVGGIIEQRHVEQNSENISRLTDGGFEEDVSAYCFYARRDYKKGEQVLLSYGTYSNLELLEHYGFLLDTNPGEKAFVPLEPEVYDMCSWPRDSLFIHQNGIPSFALLSSLRLWLTPQNQRRTVGHLIYSGSQLSPMNEVNVMKRIVKYCRVALHNLPTSIEEDKSLLHTIDKMQDLCSCSQLENFMSSFEGEARAFLENKVSVNGDMKSLLESRQVSRHLDQWKLAVQWRLMYKKILADCISYCTKVMSKLAPGIDMITINNST